MHWKTIIYFDWQNVHAPFIIYTGTNVDKAKQLLQKSGLPIQPASDLNEAAEKAVASLK